MPAPRPFRSAPLPAALVLALTGCSLSDGSPEPSPSPSAEGAAEAPAGFAEPEDPYAGMDAGLSERLHLPLYDFQLDQYERSVVGRAELTLTVECLVDLGYEAELNPGAGEDPLMMRAFGPHHEYRRYGNARVDIAEEYGFGLPDEPRGGPGDEPYTVGGGPELAEQARTAAFGLDPQAGPAPDFTTPSGEPVPEGGCMTRARRQIDPGSALPFDTDGEGYALDVPESNVLAESLLGESFTAAKDDPAVAAAAAVWEDCMAGAVDGYPGTASSSEGAAPEAAVPGAECRDTSGYLDAFAEAERAVAAGIVAEHEEALTERHERLRENLAVSREVLGW
ncbi:hypothetical protein [Nocardiopsis sp. FR6]|uniref:hypothetical protein n=1 Tax=Nocardiopsis sp. FR6 TaxID=2605986 RepID=UPI001359DA5F|nr:hypothetical protein [Nocardiopsis sp. FR6]